MSKCHEQGWLITLGCKMKACIHCGMLMSDNDFSGDCPARKETMKTDTVILEDGEYEVIGSQGSYAITYDKVLYLRKKKKEFDPSKLEPGLYLIYFKDDVLPHRYAIGWDPRSNKKWRISIGYTPPVASFDWSDVDRVELIAK